MKAFVLFLTLALVSILPVWAEDWVTTDGTHYENVRVVRVEDDAITILYKDGGALIPLFKLPPDLQERFDYDPKKAKLAAEKRMKDDAQNAIELQKEIEAADKMRQDQLVKDQQAREGH